MSQITQTIDTRFEYNGAQYDFDIRDADDAAKYENAIDKLKDAEKALPKDGKSSDLIKAHCAMLKAFFDTALEDGAGNAICGAKNNISACYDAYEAFIQFATVQKDDVIRAKNVFAKYSNRAQRRSAGKQQ